MWARRVEVRPKGEKATRSTRALETEDDHFAAHRYPVRAPPPGPLATPDRDVPEAVLGAGRSRPSTQYTSGPRSTLRNRERHRCRRWPVPHGAGAGTRPQARRPRTTRAGAQIAVRTRRPSIVRPFRAVVAPSSTMGRAARFRGCVRRGDRPGKRRYPQGVVRLHGQVPGVPREPRFVRTRPEHTGGTGHLGRSW